MNKIYLLIILLIFLISCNKTDIKKYNFEFKRLDNKNIFLKNDKINGVLFNQKKDKHNIAYDNNDILQKDLSEIENIIEKLILGTDNDKTWQNTLKKNKKDVQNRLIKSRKFIKNNLYNYKRQYKLSLNKKNEKIAFINFFIDKNNIYFFWQDDWVVDMDEDPLFFQVVINLNKKNIENILLALKE